MFDFRSFPPRKGCEKVGPRSVRENHGGSVSGPFVSCMASFCPTIRSERTFVRGSVGTRVELAPPCHQSRYKTREVRWWLVNRTELFGGTRTVQSGVCHARVQTSRRRLKNRRTRFEENRIPLLATTGTDTSSPSSTLPDGKNTRQTRSF